MKAIRFVKGNGLEQRWVARVNELRDVELSLMNKRRVNGIWLGLCWQLSPGLIILLSFAGESVLANYESST